MASSVLFTILIDTGKYLANVNNCSDPEKSSFWGWVAFFSYASTGLFVLTETFVEVVQYIMLIGGLAARNNI